MLNETQSIIVFFPDAAIIWKMNACEKINLSGGGGGGGKMAYYVNKAAVERVYRAEGGEMWKAQELAG